MKESHREGIASHRDPEPCAMARRCHGRRIGANTISLRMKVGDSQHGPWRIRCQPGEIWTATGGANTMQTVRYASAEFLYHTGFDVDAASHAGLGLARGNEQSEPHAYPLDTTPPGPARRPLQDDRHGSRVPFRLRLLCSAALVSTFTCTNAGKCSVTTTLPTRALPCASPSYSRSCTGSGYCARSIF